MRTRTWAIVIAVNVIVSAVVMLTILFLWNRVQESASPTPVFTSPVIEAASTSHAPAAVSPTAPSAPLQYTVQAGDALGVIAQAYGVSIEDLMAANSITDPNMLYVGQVLIIPVGGLAVPTAAAPLESSPIVTPLVTPLPTLTPSGPPLLEIAQVLGCGDLAAEVVIVGNQGGVANLEGWTLSNVEGNTFTFPALTLFTGAQVRVHSTVGSNTPGDLYWGRTEPAWNGGELITLRDAAGNVVDTYIVP